MSRRSRPLAGAVLVASLILAAAGVARAECVSELQDTGVAFAFVEVCAAEHHTTDDDRDSAWLSQPASAVVTASALGMGGGGSVSLKQASSTRKSTGRTQRSTVSGTGAGVNGPAAMGAVIGSFGGGLEQQSDTNGGAHRTTAGAFVSGTGLIVPFKVSIDAAQSGDENGCRQDVTVTVTAETTVSESEGVDQCPVVVPELPDIP